MKIVTYNVNGLRPRISQFGSLRKLLDSLDADIICFQETKLSKQELKADVVWADGYESFFSCTRTFDKGRTGYSGVATFCRVHSAFSSNEVALPLDAEEGLTGLLENSRGYGAKKDEFLTPVQGLEEFSTDELLKVDSEGRCIITDHGHFVLFNIYGPRAECDDTERIQFKLSFFKILQRRWESLILQGRRIFVVGDFNIAPFAIDRCDAGPDFENNEFRRWFRSLLVERGGSFIDVFRAKHPERREAYTCWSTSTGAEVFNFGSRIDHILSAGPCLHEKNDLERHTFSTCHVKECDVLTQFKRWKPGITPRWKGGRKMKLEGSDHAPVCMSLMEIPSIVQHSTPALSSRYCPQVQGCQQTLVSMLMRRQSTVELKTSEVSCSFPDEEIRVQSFDQHAKRSIHACSVTDLSSDEFTASLSQEHDTSRRDECSQDSPNGSSCSEMLSSRSNHTKPVPRAEMKKKAKPNQWSQLSLKSFFHRSSNSRDGGNSSSADTSLDQTNILSKYYCDRTSVDFDESGTLLKESMSNISGSIQHVVDESDILKESESNISAAYIQHESELDACHSSEKERRNVALLEWQRIQQLMQNSIPVCKGHDEPCVARVVKKAGPTFGRRFYVCARAEGPALNPEANCGYFKWADSKSKSKRGK